MAEVKTLGLNAAASIVTSLVVLFSALSFLVVTVKEYSADQSAIQKQFMEGREDHIKLGADVRLNSYRLDQQFGNLPPGLQSHTSEPNAFNWHRPQDDAVVYAAEESQTQQSQEERLRKYKKSIRKKRVLPQAFIRECALQPSGGAYIILGTRGRTYSLDDVIGCMARLLVETEIIGN